MFKSQGNTDRGEKVSLWGCVAGLLTLGALVIASASPASEGDDTWADGFETNGPMGPVYALADSGDGLYIGGNFSQAGTVHPARNVALWSGIAWDSLASGVTGPVRAMTFFGDDIVIGGSFTIEIGGETKFNVARWNGAEWDSLGPGLLGKVYALVVHLDELYAGGHFAGRVARWDESGDTWVPVGETTDTWDGDVLALASHPRAGGETWLVAGGNFSPEPAEYIAYWDSEDSDWKALPAGGMDGAVRALTVRPTGVRSLFVGGDFSMAGSTSNTAHVAMLSPGGWQELEQGLNGTVSALAFYKDNLYATGAFVWTGAGEMVNRIACWSSSAWDSLQGGLSDEGHALTVSGTDLIVGGDFLNAGDKGAHHLALWNGSNWDNLDGNGMSQEVLALGWFGPFLVAGGAFESAGDIPANCVAAWDGTKWRELGDGVDNLGQGDERVAAMVEFGDSLIIGGDFVQAGDTSALNVAAWDGLEWHPLGEGLSGGSAGGIPAVAALAVYDGELYAGGEFTEVGKGGPAALHVARWDGTTWEEIDNGLDGPVLAMTVYDGRLIVGGDFDQPGGGAFHNLTAWSPGASWESLSETFEPAPVRALTVHNDTLFVGGDFSGPGNYIAAHSDGLWRPFSSEPGGSVWALHVYRDSLIAGGTFTTAGGISVGYIARWAGSAWDSLGPGVNLSVRALGDHQERLYVGGIFSRAGGKPSVRIASRLAFTPTAVPDGDRDAPAGLVLQPGVPNPSRGSARLRFELSHPGPAELVVFDLQGRRIRTLADRHMAEGPHEVAWDGRDDLGRTVSGGIYLVRLRAQGRSYAQKIARLD